MGTALSPTEPNPRVVCRGRLCRGARNIIQRSNDLRTATNVVVEWLGDDTRLRIQSLDLTGDEVTVELIGPDTPPLVGPLGASLSREIGRSIVATSRWIEEAEETTAPTSTVP